MLMRFLDHYLRITRSLSWLMPLILRLFFGYTMFEAGKGKLGNMDGVIQYFESLGIILPALNAWIAASIECFGSLLLMIGLGTRIVSLPLAFVMVVAIWTAKAGDFGLADGKLVSNWQWISDAMFSVEGIYLLAFLTTLTIGPGCVSLDALLARKSGRRAA